MKREIDRHCNTNFHVLSQYVTQTVEVESPTTLKQLSKARHRNELLSEKLSNQNEQCKQLEEHIRKSDEYSCNLQHKVIITCHIYSQVHVCVCSAPTQAD